MNELDNKGLNEQEFLALYKTKNYTKPSLTADIVIFKQSNGKLSVLLIKRKAHPYINRWALPGGFANPQEPLQQTATRELKEETNLEVPAMQLIGVYSQPNRDPRGWVVSIAYGILLKQDLQATAGDDAKQAQWFVLDNNNLTLHGADATFDLEDPNCGLAFDHAQIIKDAVKALL